MRSNAAAWLTDLLRPESRDARPARRNRLLGRVDTSARAHGYWRAGVRGRPGHGRVGPPNRGSKGGLVRRRAWARRSAVLIAVMGVAAGMLAASSMAVAKTTLTLGYVTTPEHPYGLALQYYADQVKKLSDDNLEIKLLPNYQGGDVPLLNDVRGGAVDMASVSSAIWDTVKVNCFQALQAPLLLTNYGLEGKIIGGSIGAKMLQCTQQLGLVGLAIHEGGLRKPFGKSPLITPANWKGKKIRAPQSNVLSAGIRALGADPTPLALPEVFNACAAARWTGWRPTSASSTPRSSTSRPSTSPRTSTS